jgi:hypothetical protein
LFRLMHTRGEEMDSHDDRAGGAHHLSWLNEEHIARQCPDVAVHSVHFPLLDGVNPVYRILRCAGTGPSIPHPPQDVWRPCCVHSTSPSASCVPSRGHHARPHASRWPSAAHHVDPSPHTTAPPLCSSRLVTSECEVLPSRERCPYTVVAELLQTQRNTRCGSAKLFTRGG